MKKPNWKKLSILLASTLSAAALCGGLYTVDAVKTSAATDAQKYTFTDVFGEKGASDVIGKADDTKSYAAFSFSKAGGSVNVKRNVALKWHEMESAAKYFSTTFKFADQNFKTFTITLKTNPVVASDDDETTNVVTFEKKADGVYVKANDGAESKLTDATADLTLSLSEKAGAEFGSFVVNLAENDGVATEIGTFTGIGENYAPSGLTPLAFEASFAEDADESAKSEVYFKDLNGQTFEVDADNKLTDTQKPVLVLNQELYSFVIGNAYSLSTQVIDVLDRTPDSKPTYYQYNPNDVGKETYGKYIDLSSSVYFGTTNYDSNGDGENDTTVYAKEGKEYVAVRYMLGDDSHKEDSEKAEIDLAWYTNGAVYPAGVTDGIKYIPVQQNYDGAYYTATDTDITNYQTAVTTAAAEKTGGDGQYFYLPSFKGMVNDNDGFTNLSFTIAYKSDASGTNSTGSLAYNNLRFAIANVGWYEFKVFATDKAGNKMKATLDGKEVEVTTSNVWDIEEIPSFKFYIENKDFSVKEETNSKGRKDSETIYDKYSFDGFDFEGCDSPVSEYKLFYLDVDKYQKVFNSSFDENDLVSITYKQIKELAATKSAPADGDYNAFYKSLYIELLEDVLGLTKGALAQADVFVEITPDQGIDKDAYPDDYAASDDAYEWNTSTQSFVPQKQGYYMILGVFTDGDTPAYKAAAYRIIVVEDEKDVIDGEKDNTWWKNNAVSVVLFGIAGVLLIIIVILLVIKPSDETLEDVDKKVKKNKKTDDKE